MPELALVRIDGLPYAQPTGTYTGAEVRRFAHPPIGFDRDLYLERDEGEVRVQSGDYVTVVSGLSFHTIKRGDVAYRPDHDYLGDGYIGHLDAEGLISMNLMYALPRLMPLGLAVGAEHPHGRPWVRHDANVRHFIAALSLAALRRLPPQERADAVGLGGRLRRSPRSRVALAASFLLGVVVTLIVIGVT